ncbi:MAG: nucleotide exchange factor GrpE [Granulosicoccaceae bacterium]
MTPENDDPIERNAENDELDDSIEIDSNLVGQENAENEAQAIEGVVADIGADTDDPLGFGSSRMADEATPAELAEQLAAAEAKASDHWERLLLMQADMENQRKRAQKEVSNAKKFALEGVVNELLPVRDSLEMGIVAAQQEDAGVEQIVEGSELTLKMLTQVFEKYNIIEIDPIDERFNPEFHQAMSMQEIEGKEPNTVASVLQKGYTLNDRLIRPALVMVAK